MCWYTKQRKKICLQDRKTAKLQSQFVGIIMIYATDISNVLHVVLYRQRCLHSFSLFRYVHKYIYTEYRNIDVYNTASC